MKRLLVVIATLIALVFAAAFAGCGDGENTTPELTVSPSDENTVTDTDAESEPTAAPPTPEPTTVPERTTIDALLDSGRVLNLAHAGGDQDAPHSTMFAFAEAAALGVDMLEVDVQLTGDGVLIVQHDDTVDRTTNGMGPVSNYTLAEIQALDAAHWWSPDCWRCDDLEPDRYIYRGVRSGDIEPPPGYTPDDFRIITLAELVERFPSMPIDIEIKGNAPQAQPVVEALAELIATYDLTDNVVVVSFDDDLIAAFEAAAPGVETSPGVTEMTNWILAGQPLVGHRIVQVPPVFDGVPIVTEGFMQLAATDGVAVWVWPDDADVQENEAFYRQMIDMGASGIIAGRPADMAAATE